MTKKVEYGTSVHLSSGNGNILAVGAPHHGYISSTADPTQVNTDGGGVFLYRYDGSDWSLLSIIAGLPSEQIGGNLAVSSDGSRIAIRRNKALSLYLNEVEVYNVGVSGVPTKVGSDLSCGGRGDSMSLSSDGSRIVVSCHGINGGRGLVEIFDWTDGEWSSIGRLSVANTSEINNNDRFGWVVSLDDGGNRLAVSAPNYDVDGMSDRGLVRVYEYANGSWDQIGGDIVGSTAEEVFGYAMDISGKGLSVAVGAYVRSVGGVSGAGTVSVFSLPPDGTTWVPVGQLVTGGASQQRFGRSVSISTDGKRVAASSRGPSSRGLVQLLDFNGTQWEISGELLGVRNQERLGYALEGVTLTGDGNRVACGSVWGNNTAGLLTGSVRVFNNLKASGAPSLSPSVAVSVAPTGIPSVVSSSTPTVLISTAIPTTMAPSSFPVTQVTAAPNMAPTAYPVIAVSSVPNATPTASPEDPTTLAPTPSSVTISVTPGPAPSSPQGSSSPTSLTSGFPTVKLSKFDWDLELVGNATVSFRDGSATEMITLNYNISNRRFVVTVFDESCTIPVPESIIGIESTIETSTHSNLQVSIDMKQDAVVNSVVWRNDDSGVGFVNLCVRVALVLDDDRATAINLHKQILYVTVGLEKRGLSVIGVSLDQNAGDVTNKGADTDYAVVACQCTSSFICGSDILAQGSDVFICVYSNSVDVQITGVSALNFYQGNLFGTMAIVNSTKDSFTAVTVSWQGALIRSQMRSEFFEETNPLPVDVEGVAELSFSAQGGRRLVRSVPLSRLLIESKSSNFNVSLGLQGNGISNASGAGHAAGTYLLAAVTIGSGLFSLFA